jgi:NAD+ diphosphatase
VAGVTLQSRTLQHLALSRATLDRAAHLRTEPELVQRLLADPATAVLLVDDDRAPVLPAPGHRLALVDPATAARLRQGIAGPGDGGLAAFLGTDGAGRAHVLLATPGAPRAAQPAPSPAGDAARPADPPSPDGASWLDLRAVGDLLDDTDAGIMTCAVALANWHGAHPRCARCGTVTRTIQAGWARSCPACGAEHYPRTDPAVIMAVVDAADRILLGRQGRWPDRRFSTLAGFVEPGEPLEAAVRREVAEEAGIVVGDVAYRGSQPWPFPSSLMLGFRAQAVSTEITVDGAELAQARWWSREELALDLATGELLLPGAVSIARRLIEDWYGGPLHDAGGVWR